MNARMREIERVYARAQRAIRVRSSERCFGVSVHDRTGVPMSESSGAALPSLLGQGGQADEGGQVEEQQTAPGRGQEAEEGQAGASRRACFDGCETSAQCAHSC